MRSRPERRHTDNPAREDALARVLGNYAAHTTGCATPYIVRPFLNTPAQATSKLLIHVARIGGGLETKVALRPDKVFIICAATC
jgi:hypothetical protein